MLLAFHFVHLCSFTITNSGKSYHQWCHFYLFSLIHSFALYFEIFSENDIIILQVEKILL